MVDGGNPFAWRQSSIETYLRCGLRYEFEIVKKANRRVTRSMAIGTGVHGGEKLDLTRKMIGVYAPNHRDIVDVSVATYDDELRKSEHEIPAIEQGNGRDITADGARTYAAHVAPWYEKHLILGVEEKLEMQFDGWVLEGTLDVITDWGIGDLKTGRRWTQAMVDDSRQLTAYSLLFEAKYGRLPRRVWIQSLHAKEDKKSKRVDWAHVRGLKPSTRTEAQLDGYVNLMELALRGIQGGIFLPAPQGAWWCSAKWCPHHKECPAFSGRQEDEDE